MKPGTPISPAILSAVTIDVVEFNAGDAACPVGIVGCRN